MELDGHGATLTGGHGGGNSTWGIGASQSYIEQKREAIERAPR
jgi:hypothetical protein